MNKPGHDIAEIQAIRAQAEALAKFAQGFFVLSEGLIDNAQICRRYQFAREDLSPERIGLASLLHISRDEMMVVRLNIKLFPFTDSTPKIVGFRGIFRRQLLFTKIVERGT